MLIESGPYSDLHVCLQPWPFSGLGTQQVFNEQKLIAQPVTLWPLKPGPVRNRKRNISQHTGRLARQVSALLSHLEERAQGWEDTRGVSGVAAAGMAPLERSPGLAPPGGEVPKPRAGSSGRHHPAWPRAPLPTPAPALVQTLGVELASRPHPPQESS